MSDWLYPEVYPLIGADYSGSSRGVAASEFAGYSNSYSFISASKMVLPMPSLKNAKIGSNSAVKSMEDNLLHIMARRQRSLTPLPARDGLTASRVRLPGPEPVTAFDFLVHVIAEQRHRHPDDDATAVLARFEQGQVKLFDGTVLAPADLIQPGTDVFFYRRPAPEVPVPYEIDVVFEDDDLMVVDKPPFLATMPRAAHITETVTVRLRRQTGNEELTPAHRLDRMTSGLLLLTKRRELRGAYQDLFASRSVQKRYEAIARYADIVAPTVWRSHIDKRHGEIAATVDADAPPNSETILHHTQRLAPAYEAHLQSLHGVLAQLASYLLEPVTGRTHQLRIHMSAAGIAILGDPVYPDVKPYGEEDFAVPMRLKSTELAFTDPLTGQPRRFTARGYSSESPLNNR